MIRDVHVYFNKIDKMAHSFINEKLKNSELSMGLFFYILELEDHDGINLNHLSQCLFMDRANTTRAITKLIKLGYVVKKTDEQDLRAYKLYLTEKGHSAAQKLNDIFIEWRDLISEGVSDDEAEEVLAISKKLYANALKYYESKNSSCN